MRNPESISVNEDPRLIPVWSIVAAAAAFMLVEYYFWLVLPDQQHHVPPLGLRTYFNISFGLLVSLYFLMVGYVSKDAPRRAMSARFWIALCFVMPGGIGAVLYFLLRQPEVSRCPACSTHVPVSYTHLGPDYRDDNNPTNRDEVVEHVKQVKRDGMGVISMKLVGDGTFTRHEDRQAAMRFAFKNAGIDSATVGFKSTREIDEAIDNMNLALA